MTSKKAKTTAAAAAPPPPEYVLKEEFDTLKDIINTLLLDKSENWFHNRAINSRDVKIISAHKAIGEYNIPIYTFKFKTYGYMDWKDYELCVTNASSYWIQIDGKEIIDSKRGNDVSFWLPTQTARDMVRAICRNPTDAYYSLKKL